MAVTDEPSSSLGMAGMRRSRGLHATLRLAVLLALAYGTIALGTIALSRQPGNVATLWYANALASSVLLLRPWQDWPWLAAAVALGVFGANLAAGDPPGMALAFAPANLVEVLVAAGAMRMAGLDRADLHSPRPMLQLLVLGALLPPLLGAMAGALTLSLLVGAPFGRVWLQWFGGSAIGSAGLLPLASLALRESPAMLSRQLQHPLLWTLVPLSAGVTLLAMAYLPYPFIVLALPLLWAAMVLPPTSVALVGFVTSLSGALAISTGVFQPPPVIDELEHAFVYLSFAASLVPAQLLTAARADMRASHERLAARERELHRANQGLEQFVRMASHDLREPLNTITQFGQLIEQDDTGQLSPASARYLHLMTGAAQRLRALLDDVLHYARAQRGVEEDARPVPLDAVLQRAIASLAARIERSGAVIELPPLPAVRGEGVMLELLFQNLLSNAMKFVPAGRAPRITLGCERRDGLACIEVQDNGIGIAAADMAKLFKPFQRLHLRREYEGTGLGLALAQQIAQAHGGHVEVRSTPGEGSCFTVCLPLAEDDRPLLPRRAF